MNERSTPSSSHSSLPILRVALIGLGSRGLRTLQRYRHLDGVSVVAVADKEPKQIAEAQALLHAQGMPAPLCSSTEVQDIFQRGDVDLVLVCTDWFSHAHLAVEAMEAGKHVAVEVPAAVTLEECWRIVEVSRRTGRCFFLLENCCFDPFHLHALELVGSGHLGEIKHCEGAYLHDLHTWEREHCSEVPLYRWMDEEHPFTSGNAYPTHGIGPMSQLLGIHREDRFTELYATSALPDQPLSRRLSTILLRTARGCTALLQLDLSTPRPYSRLQSVMGTEGYLCKYPSPHLQLSSLPEALRGDAVADFLAQSAPSPMDRWIKEGQAKGVENVMNYVMDAHLIDCLKRGLSPAISVEDAALWSSIIELSARSEETNRPVPIPDFTQDRPAR